MKIFLTLFIIIFICIGCNSAIPEPVYITEYETITETITETVVVTETIVDNTEIDRLNEELEDYRDLINNLNQLLSNVYYVGWGFTGFSIEYNNKYYLITAGHGVDNEYGFYPDLKFKANFSDDWIYPKLLDYSYNPDYAIFYSDKIESGLEVSNDCMKPSYILGSEGVSINIFRDCSNQSIEGESGSPVLNRDCEVVGILIGGFTSINKVTEAIDNMK